MKRTTSEGIKYLSALLTQAQKRQELPSFLADLLTAAEVDDLVQRVEIIRALLAGETQRAISQSKRVSISKVTRGSNALRSSRGGFKNILK